MFYGLKRIYIFNSTGLQAYITILNNEDDVEIKFIFDNDATVKGMAISARLLKLLGSSKRRPVFMYKDNIVMYLDKIMLIGITENHFSDEEMNNIRAILGQLHEYIAMIDSEDVGAFIRNLVYFIKKKKSGTS